MQRFLLTNALSFRSGSFCSVVCCCEPKLIAFNKIVIKSERGREKVPDTVPLLQLVSKFDKNAHVKSVYDIAQSHWAISQCFTMNFAACCNSMKRWKRKGGGGSGEKRHLQPIGLLTRKSISLKRGQYDKYQQCISGAKFNVHSQASAPIQAGRILAIALLMSSCSYLATLFN